ncbi:MAG: hypothetical protein AAF202_11470, partial [Pseudomonadota bacterium]
EIIKQVLVNVTGIDFKKTLESAQGEMSPQQIVEVPKAVQDATGLPPAVPMPTPFPETWKIYFTGKSNAITSTGDTIANGQEYLKALAADGKVTQSTLDKVLAYWQKSENNERVLNNTIRVSLEDFQKREKSLRAIENKMVKTSLDCEAMHIDGTKDEWSNFCSSGFAKTKRFQACYFVQRAAGQKSPQAAFNQCAYNGYNGAGDLRVTKAETQELLEAFGAMSEDFFWTQYQLPFLN